MCSVSDFYQARVTHQRKQDLYDKLNSDLKHEKDGCLTNKRLKTKVNDVRTKLLIHADEERNKYIKNSKILINNRQPKEIVDKYSQSITVSFNNPIIRSEGSGIEQLSHRGMNNTNTHNNHPHSHREGTTLHSNMNSNAALTAHNGPPTLKINTEFSMNNSNNGFKSSKALGVFYFSKCIKEIGKEFIDHRKRNVSYKKLDKEIGGGNKKTSQMLIDTELSYIETINNLNSTKNRSSNKSTGKRKSERTFSFPKNFEDIFIDKEEKEARNIQNNYNKLQELVEKLKGPDIEESCERDIDIDTDNTPINRNFKRRDSKTYDFYKNFKSNFNEELFDILEYKGVKFNHKLISSSNVLSNVYNNIFGDEEIGTRPVKVEKKFDKTEEKVENKLEFPTIEIQDKLNLNKPTNKKDEEKFPIRSIIHPKKNSEIIPKNPFSQNIIKSEDKNKRPKTISLNSEFEQEKIHRSKLNRNLFPTSKNFGSENGVETNETTRNVSLSKNKFPNNFNYYLEDENSVENYEEEYGETIQEMQETPINKKCTLTLTYTNSSNKDILEFLSDNDLFENRISNITSGGITNDKLEMMKTYGTNNSDNQILQLIKCNTNKYDSEISKNSESDVSRYSNSNNVSKNKSEITQMSNISELSIEFTDKNL